MQVNKELTLKNKYLFIQNYSYPTFKISGFFESNNTLTYKTVHLFLIKKVQKVYYNYKKY